MDPAHEPACSVLLPAFTAAAGSLLLLAWAWRGRHVGDHPHCRKCEFDLFGNPTAERCGECGTDLMQRRAITAGLRRRRPLIALTAVLLLLGALTWGGHSTYSAAWFDDKPNWLLRLELGLGSRRSAALDELKVRIRSTGSGFSASPQREEPYIIAEPSVRRLLSVAANPADFDDDCRDFLRSVWFYLRPPARQDAAAAIVPLLGADDVAVAIRAARVLADADRYRDTGDIDAQLRRAADVLIGRGMRNSGR
jgi:hypothetical protein